MATTTEVRQRAEWDLASITMFVNDLDELYAEWDNLDEVHQVSFSQEWAHLMADVLTELDAYSCSGLLSETQQERYRDLKRKLKHLMPLISKLNWYRPPVSLEEVA